MASNSNKEKKGKERKEEEKQVYVVSMPKQRIVLSTTSEIYRIG